MCDWEGEAIEGGFRASFFKPGGVLVRECDDDELIRREGAKRILDRFHGVGITDPELNVVGRCRLRKLVGPLACLSARVVLRVNQSSREMSEAGATTSICASSPPCARTDLRRSAAGTEAVATTSSRRGTASAYSVLPLETARDRSRLARSGDGIACERR